MGQSLRRRLSVPRNPTSPRTKYSLASLGPSRLKFISTAIAYFDRKICSMKSRVDGPCGYFQILNSVVQFVFIFVMNNFFFLERSAKKSGSYEPMLKNIMTSTTRIFNGIGMARTKNVFISSGNIKSLFPGISIFPEFTAQVLSRFSSFTHLLFIQTMPLRCQI